MKVHCRNCGEEFEDPRPGTASILIATNATPDEIAGALNSEPYCDACSKEWNRLNKQARELIATISNSTHGYFMQFGQERRRARL